MTESRLHEIKRIFARYRINKSQLKQIELPGINGTSYDKIAVKTDKSKNNVEQLVITYLIEKEKIERELALVDMVYSFFADDRDEELAHLIDMRFRCGNPHWKAANGCYISDRQGLRWLERAYAKAEEIGEKLHIF